MIDQFILYDQALLTWVTDTLPPLLKGRTTQVLIAVSRKAFAEVTTLKVVDNNTVTLPRISVTRLSHRSDPKRFNSNRIRRLGWTDSTLQTRLRSGKYPAPIVIPYQIDLWTKYSSEMNVWEQKILFDLASQYIYLTIRPDDVWGDKQYILMMGGDITDNSDLDPGEGNGPIRKTFTLNAECWLFDQALASTAIIKRLEGQLRDIDTLELFDTLYVPPVEVIGVGTGAQVTFGPITLNRFPVLKNLVVINTLIGGVTSIVYDNGSGVLTGSTASGTIDYVTGEVNITYTLAPDIGEDITVTYFTDQT